jgi:hypothetical protein
MPIPPLSDDTVGSARHENMFASPSKMSPSGGSSRDPGNVSALPRALHNVVKHRAKEPAGRANARPCTDEVQRVPAGEELVRLE